MSAGNLGFALIPGIFYIYVLFAISFQIWVRPTPGLPLIASQAKSCWNKGEFCKLKFLYKKWARLTSFPFQLSCLAPECCQLWLTAKHQPETSETLIVTKNLSHLVFFSKKDVTTDRERRWKIGWLKCPLESKWGILTCPCLWPLIGLLMIFLPAGDLHAKMNCWQFSHSPHLFVNLDWAINIFLLFYSIWGTSSSLIVDIAVYS